MERARTAGQERGLIVLAMGWAEVADSGIHAGFSRNFRMAVFIHVRAAADSWRFSQVSAWRSTAIVQRITMAYNCLYQRPLN